MIDSRTDLEFLKITASEMLPDWADRDTVTRFFHETMKPWQDSMEEIGRAFDYAFSTNSGEGGFLMLAGQDRKLVGALLMLKTGMGNYIPPWLLVFITIDPSARGRGLGRRLCERSISECDGDVKLHVEYDNPAKRLYERIGFVNKYAEMRLYQ